MTTTAVERHAELVAAGWTTRLDGKWRPPDPRDLRVYTFAAAWAEHTADMQDVAEQIAEAVDWTGDHDGAA